MVKALSVLIGFVALVAFFVAGFAIFQSFGSGNTEVVTITGFAVSDINADSGSDNEQTPEEPTKEPDVQKTHTIKIIRGLLNPPILTIKQGDSVAWINEDKTFYQNIVSASSSEINSGKIMPGESYTYAFDRKGEFLYLSLTTEQVGKIIVE